MVYVAAGWNQFPREVQGPGSQMKLLCVLRVQLRHVKEIQLLFGLI